MAENSILEEIDENLVLEEGGATGIIRKKEPDKKLVSQKLTLVDIELGGAPEIRFSSRSEDERFYYA